MTSKELHKVGKAVSGLKNVVEYVIDVNYEAMDLLPDSDVLVLEDVLDENLTLDTTSLKSQTEIQEKRYRLNAPSVR